MDIWREFTVINKFYWITVIVTLNDNNTREGKDNQRSTK